MTKYGRPFWWDDAEPRTTECGSAPESVDVLIVGAGFAGLGAAIPLARAGRQVAVFDRVRAGDGASTRNGGIASGNIRWRYSELTSRLGRENAAAVYKAGIKARIDLLRFIEAEEIDCDLQHTGRFTGAFSAQGLVEMEREADLMRRDLGIESVVISPNEQSAETGSDLYHGGIVRPDIGGLHPGKLHREMLRLAMGAGATVFDGVSVNGISRAPSGFDVSVDGRSVRADHVIVATNGYTSKGLPWLRRRLVPVISEIIATAPLPDGMMNILMPKARMCGEARALGHYYRPSPSGNRILFGGRRYDRDSTAARARLFRHLTDVFPELAGIDITHHWFGYVAFPRDMLPKLAVQDGVIYATGFCGSGVVWARWFGERAASMVLQRDDATTPFSDMPFARIPLYDGTPWFMTPVMGWYRIKDWMDRR